MSSPLYEKRIGSTDYVEIDGTEYSNAFREFGLSSVHTTVPAGGFNETGVEEQLAGTTTQGFTGTFYISSEVASTFWGLHIAKTVVDIVWQPNGLVDNTGPSWHGNCTINEFNPSDTFGDVSTSPFSATIADALGIRMTGT